MSLLDDPSVQSTVQEEFSGADQLSDADDIRPPACVSLQNCEFVTGGVWQRRGFATKFSLGKSIATMWSWLQESFNRLLYLDVTTPSNPQVISRDLPTNTESTVLGSGIGQPAGMYNASVGFREIMAFYDKNGLATTEGRVWDGTFNGPTPNVEKLFPRPLLTSELTFAFTEPGAGSVTIGLHTFAIVVTTWNGAQSPPGPWGGASILIPQSFTAAGGKDLNVGLTPVGTWPMWVNQIQLMMTPVNNPNNWYLVPGTIQDVPRGSALAVNILFDIDDLTLQAKGTNVTVSGTVPSLFSLYSQDALGAGPFRPHVVIPFGNRMVYLARLPSPDSLSSQGAIFISEASKPQFITLAFHLLSLPEFLDTVTACVLGATLYVFGPDWTFAFSDNTQFPVQWAPCRTISRYIGCQFIKGITVNTVRKIVWVANKTGLFAFNGATYDIRPSTYTQGAADWSSINFSAAAANAANSLQVVDYPDFRIVVVMCPVGVGQITANYMLVWDYTNGYDADSIRYCGKWWINRSGPAQINLGSIALIHSTNEYEELWVACASSTQTGKIYRQKFPAIDAPGADPVALYDDDGQGTDMKYRTASLVDIDEPYYQQLGATWRLTGRGTLSISAYGLDQINPQTLAPITGQLTPGKTYFRGLDAQSQAIHYEISNGAVAGAYVRLSRIRAWFSKWLAEGDS